MAPFKPDQLAGYASRASLGGAVATATTGLMIESAEIQNFRCFESVRLPKCPRLNLIVGKNASGKTALLEALFLATGPSPELAVRFRVWRGYEPTIGGAFDQLEEAVWANLFYRYDLGKEINISLHGSDRQHERSLKVTYGTRESFVSFDMRPGSNLGDSAVRFEWTRSGQKPFLVRPRLTMSGYQFPETEFPSVDIAYFPPSSAGFNAENVARFTTLAKKRTAGAAIEAIKKEFPFIRNIDIQAHAGQPMLHADIPWLPEKVPLAPVSAGVAKFAALVLAISEKKNSILFVDEIENGFHYSRLESMWRSLNEICAANNVQIFATTHSKECIDALATVCKEDLENASLIRTELGDDGTVKVHQFQGPSFSRGLKGEVR